VPGPDAPVAGIADSERKSGQLADLKSAVWADRDSRRDGLDRSLGLLGDPRNVSDAAEMSQVSLADGLAAPICSLVVVLSRTQWL
jgi:hypothetical protein